MSDPELPNNPAGDFFAKPETPKADPATQAAPNQGAPNPIPPTSAPNPPAPMAAQIGAAGPQRAAAGPGASGQAWYSGPLPIKDLAPRESVGSAIGRTVVKALTFLIVVFGGLFGLPLLLFGCVAAVASSAGGAVAEGDGDGPNALVAGESNADINLALIEVTGPILGEDPGVSGFFDSGGAYGYTIKEDLIELADDEDIDGVILQMDTPGGTIFGSRAIADGVAEYQEISGKPVVAFVESISASGGMYAMAGADEILADHGTIIGSIGVIFGPFQTFNNVTAIDGGILGGGVTTEGGIEVEYLTAGRSKDLGNPYRPIEPAERAVLQESLDNAYDEFVNVVSEGRGIPASTIENSLGALIYGEQQALDNDLIDGIANRDDAYARAAEMAGADENMTWSVRSFSRGEPGFLELLGARVVGDADSGSETNLARPVGTVCLGSTNVLAYHGDPLDLCRTFAD